MNDDPEHDSDSVEETTDRMNLNQPVRTAVMFLPPCCIKCTDVHCMVRHKVIIFAKENQTTCSDSGCQHIHSGCKFNAPPSAPLQVPEEVH